MKAARAARAVVPDACKVEDARALPWTSKAPPASSPRARWAEPLWHVTSVGGSLRPCKHDVVASSATHLRYVVQCGGGSLTAALDRHVLERRGTAAGEYVVELAPSILHTQPAVFHAENPLGDSLHRPTGEGR